MIALNIWRELEEEWKKEKKELGEWENVHFLAECLKLGFEEAFREVGHAECDTVKLLSRQHAIALSKRVTAQPRLVPVRAEASDTVYCCAMDAEGNCCSFIQSNYEGFGTGIVPRGCGFSLQNRGNNFFVPSLDGPRKHPNVLQACKRPYHTIIPGRCERRVGQVCEWEQDC